jgi:16S rRNA (cytosine1402-N4)-methyltransferase
MLKEVLEALKPSAGGRYVDGTLGGAGHAEAILEASSPGGWLYGCDQDDQAIERAQIRLARFAGRYELRHGNFSELAEWLPEASCDGVLLDLGISSPQVDDPARGFSLIHDGPLDMRMDRRRPVTAAELVNTASGEELARIFRDYGDEREARRFARAICHDRVSKPFRTTRQLAELIERLSPRAGRKTHPATRVFQSLRIKVNEELVALEQGLVGALGLLKPGGILAVITFHSVEDRIVKQFGRAKARDYTFPGEVDVPELRQPRAPEVELVTRRAVTPGAEELAGNPRSRSAQLRVMRRLQT